MPATIERQKPSKGVVEQPKSISSEIVRDASFFTLCTYIYQLIAFGVGIVTKRFLGPEGAGIWSFFMMVLSYFALQHFGIIDGSERQIAFYRGKGDYDYAHKIKDNMFGVVGVISMITSIGVIGFIAISSGILSPHLNWALIHIAFILPIFMAVNYITVSLRATKRFKLLGTTLVSVALLNASVGLLLVWHWGLGGMYAAFFAINLANILFWYFSTKKDGYPLFKFSFSKMITSEVLKVGFPIALFGLIWTLLRTADSMVVVSSMGTEALGYYALGVSINAFIYQTPNAISIVMFPRFQEKFGKSADVQSLRDYVIKPIIALAFFALPLLIGSAFFFVPVLVKVALPKFIPGIAPLKILLGGTFWISMVLMPFHLLITINRQMRAVLFGILGAALSFGGASLAVGLDWGLAGTASMVALGYMLFFLSVFVYVVKSSNWPLNIWGFVMRIVGGFVWMAGVALAVDNLIGWGDSPLSMGLSALLKFTIYSVCALPLFFFAERQTAVIGKLKNHLKDIFFRAIRRRGH